MRSCNTHELSQRSDNFHFQRQTHVVGIRVGRPRSKPLEIITGHWPRPTCDMYNPSPHLKKKNKPYFFCSSLLLSTSASPFLASSFECTNRYSSDACEAVTIVRLQVNLSPSLSIVSLSRSPSLTLPLRFSVDSLSLSFSLFNGTSTSLSPLSLSLPIFHE